MPSPLRRLRFAFTLRTLFIVLTIFCCWLAKESQAIRERHAVFEMLRMKGGLYIAGPNLAFPGPEQSTLRRVLGDVPPQANIFLRLGYPFTDQEILRVKRAFPEATVEKYSWQSGHNTAEPWPTAEENRREREWKLSGRP